MSLPILPWLPYLHSVPRDVIKMYHVPLSWYSSLTLGGWGEDCPSWTLLGRILNHDKAEVVSERGNDMLGSLGAWLWPWHLHYRAHMSPVP